MPIKRRFVTTKTAVASGLKLDGQLPTLIFGGLLPTLVALVASVRASGRSFLAVLVHRRRFLALSSRESAGSTATRGC
jgi:hypothetical protein